MSKFKIGDLVWVRSKGTNGLIKGEHAGIITSDVHLQPSNPPPGCTPIAPPWYSVDIENIPVPAPAKTWGAHETRLRPRKDDYQQHEPRSSQEKIKEIIRLGIGIPTLEDARISYTKIKS